jgi:hypothetical protein
MDIQSKLIGFAMLSATWISWVLAGLAVGGLAMALDRAIYIIRSSAFRGRDGVSGELAPVMVEARVDQRC